MARATAAASPGMPGPDQRRVLRQYVGQGIDGGQRVEVRHDGLQRVMGGVGSFCHDQGDGFADMAHMVQGQGGARGLWKVVPGSG